MTLGSPPWAKAAPHTTYPTRRRGGGWAFSFRYFNPRSDGGVDEAVASSLTVWPRKRLAIDRMKTLVEELNGTILYPFTQTERTTP